MKSIKILFCYCLPAVVLLSSCSKDDDAAPQPQPQPPVTNQPSYSAPALELDHILTPTTLEDRNSDPTVIDYYANKDIWVSAKLTVKPGVVIAFAEDALLNINTGGVISAEGIADKKIKFIGKTARKGFWKGIIVYSNSSDNTFTHTEILHGGSQIILDGHKAGIALFESARVSMSNTLVSQSGGFGFYLRENGILVSFSANNFSQNQEAPLLISANHAAMLDEASIYTSNNGRNVVEVKGSMITGNSEVTWPAFADGTPFRILGDMDTRTGWKLKPGTIIEVAEDKRINVEIGGYLNAVGTAAKPIIITGAVQSTGSWNGLAVYTRSVLNVLDYVKIKYAGGHKILGNAKTAIALFGTSQTSLVVQNSEISHSGGYGIHVYGKLASLNGDVETSNAFTSNALGNVFYEIF